MPETDSGATPSPSLGGGRVALIPLHGVPEVGAGDDLALLLLRSIVEVDHLRLEPGDVLVVSSKVVSKALGHSQIVGSDADRDRIVQRESVRLVAARRTPRGTAQIVRSVAGPVMAAAGVDASNTTAGTVLTLPPDPDSAARDLRHALVAAGAPLVGVVVTDTSGRAWRTGQTDFALGVAGLAASEDLRGTLDASGQLLEVTERAVADEIAAAADLVKGKASGVPAALVRGLGHLVTVDDGPGASVLLRDPTSDWFRLGHVEAVRAALGVDLTAVEAPSVLPESLLHRVLRAATVATTGWPGVELRAADGPDGTLSLQVRTPDAFAAGAVSARLQAALWAEDLRGTLDPADPPPVIMRIRPA